jgi:hypothetical protein
MKPFERNKIIKTMEDVNRLAERLSKCPEVSRFNDGQHKEGWTLADSFADIEGEFREFLDEQLPKLTQAEGEELSGLLFEIGVAFQHIMYHIIEHQKFYKYLMPEGTEVFGEPRRKS